ncbi:hypothetical protein [Acetobacterium malicum]|uniref:hypothetical protein n=1 Tax=Acetobacterium malicum TaxID=52692 RepID=UPI00047ABE31|nr:hypothetical protein [Acetobacterium dehalogenans]
MDKRRGAPLGNKNSVGHGAPPGNKNAAGHGAPTGNSNALKTGVHEHIDPETLPYDEKCLFNNLIKLYQDQKPAEVVFKYIRAMCVRKVTRIKPDGSKTVIPIPYNTMLKYMFNNPLAYAHIVLWKRYPWVFMVPDEEG